MIVQVVGKQRLDFDTKEGSHINGTNFFILYPNSNVDGLKADRIFVPIEIEIPKGLELNKKANFDFDNKGKVVGISIN